MKKLFKTLLFLGAVLVFIVACNDVNEGSSQEVTLADLGEEPVTVNIPSTQDGGLNNFDSTGRIQLESYQKAQKTNGEGEPAHYGEVLRIDVMDQQAKGAIAFREGYINGNEDPRSTFWIVSHGEANDSTEDKPLWHNHTSFEIPDEQGQLQTVMEMPFGTFNEPNAYGVAQEDMYVRTTQKLITSNKGLYVEGLEGSDRTVKFSTGQHSTDADRRFAVGIDGKEENGNNSGSNFRVISYDDKGTYKATAIAVDRETNNVGVNTSSPTSSLHVEGDTIRLAEKRTISSANEAGNVGDYCWDDNYWYVCVAPNTWKRSALEKW